MVTVVSITTDGTTSTYTMVYSEAVDVTTPGNPEFYWWFWSPGNSEWSQPQNVQQAAADAITFDLQDPDCTYGILVAQPSSTTAAHPFQVAAPLPQVTTTTTADAVEREDPPPPPTDAAPPDVSAAAAPPPRPSPSPVSVQPSEVSPRPTSPTPPSPTSAPSARSTPAKSTPSAGSSSKPLPA